MSYHNEWSNLSFNYLDINYSIQGHFTKYFSLHQFGVITHVKCETMVHDVRVMLDLHPNWVMLQVDVYSTSFQYGVTINHFSRVTIFIWFFKSFFYICSTILCTPIPTVIFSSLLTWGFHTHFVHFVRIKHTTRRSIGRSVLLVYLCTLHLIMPTLLVFIFCWWMIHI